MAVSAFQRIHSYSNKNLCLLLPGWVTKRFRWYLLIAPQLFYSSHNSSLLAHAEPDAMKIDDSFYALSQCRFIVIVAKVLVIVIAAVAATVRVCGTLDKNRFAYKMFYITHSYTHTHTHTPTTIGANCMSRHGV